MFEFYPQIKLIHIGLALASGTLFAARGAGVLAGMGWPRHAAVRIASYGIDTALLTDALMLASMLPGAMFANGWLYSKLAFLALYIVLGVLALRRARSRRARAWCYLAALLAFGMVYSIARAHHPLGLLARWWG